jgi:predicted RNase H-like HicB family nuclease
VPDKKHIVLELRVSEIVELPGCHTQAKSMDKLLERTKEAIQAYLKTEKAPKISEEFIGVQQIVAVYLPAHARSLTANWR